MYYYTSEQTAEYLKHTNDCVYLFGSCGGYSNFGDIIQLKNAIAFHKNVTNKEPVIVMFLNALQGPSHPVNLRKWYESEHFIFVSDVFVDAADLSLFPLQSLMAGSQLHIYGGGFLNRFWGDGMMEVIESLLKDFSISTYVFSGQQIDEYILPRLKKLTKQYKPEVVGLRDKQSLAYVKKHIPDINSKFSFDDVTEVFELWSAHRVSRNAYAKKILSKSVLWHFNTSSYVTDNKNELQHKVLKLREQYPKYNLIVAHAYNDRRRDLLDSLQTIVDLENDFPYESYKVVNLAQIALQCQPYRNSMPNLKELFSNVKIAVTSSYHTAMLMSFFNTPVFLLAANDYYVQKQKGLGYSTDFTAYLNNPMINLKSFKAERQERKEWISKFSEYFSHTSSGQVVKLKVPGAGK